MLINVLMLTGPVFMLQIYDRILASGSVPTLLVIGSIALVLYLFMGLFETIRGRILVRVGHSLDAQLTGRAYSLSTELPLNGREGKRHLRPVEDLDNVRQFFPAPAPRRFSTFPGCRFTSPSSSCSTAFWALPRLPEPSLSACLPGSTI